MRVQLCVSFELVGIKQGGALTRLGVYLQLISNTVFAVDFQNDRQGGAELHKELRKR